VEPDHPPALSRLQLLVIIGVALGVRILYFVQYYGTPFYLVPMWDAAEYYDMASSLARGEAHIAWPFRPPLYPLLLGVVFLLLGPGLLLPTLLQIGLGVANALLVAKIASRIASPSAGLIAGLAMALSGMMVYFDLELLPTTLEVFLLLLLISELTGKASSGRSAIRAGLYLALGALTRPTVLALGPLAFYAIYRRDGGRGVLRFTAALAGPLMLVMMLHLLTGSGPIPLSAQGGVNFYIGNHPNSDGISATLPGIGVGWGWETIVAMAESKSGRKMRPAEVDKYYWGEGFREIAADPVGWAGRSLRKAGLFWNHHEISNNRDLYYQAHRYPVLRYLLWLGLPVALSAALIGIVLQRRQWSVQIIAGAVFLYYLAVVPFFVNGRFRHPVTPLLFILAAVGVIELVRLMRTGGDLLRRQLPTVGIALALGLYLPFAANSRIDPRRWDYGFFTEGTALARLGDETGAKRLYEEALRANPRAPYAHYELAVIALGQGDRPGAAEHFRQELDNQPGNARAWLRLGMLWDEEGREAEALAAFRQTLTLRDDLPEAGRAVARILVRRGRTLAASGQAEAARRCFAEALRYQPDDPVLQRLAGSLTEGSE